MTLVVPARKVAPPLCAGIAIVTVGVWPVGDTQETIQESWVTKELVLRTNFPLAQHYPQSLGFACISSALRSLLLPFLS